MTEERWDNIQMCYEDIKEYCDDILDRRMCRSELENIISAIEKVNDHIYNICESDYSDCSFDMPAGYDDILEMLPDGSNLSVEEMDRLKAHIESWKRGE